MGEILTHIRAILSTTPLRWSQLTAIIPDDLLRQRPAPAEWSALECLQHIVDTERLVFPLRLETLRHARDIPALDPDQQGSHGAGDLTPAALAAVFAQLRAANLEALAQVRAQELDQSGIHSELGRVTLGQMLHEWAAHDLDHTIQAERALMQPFIRGCGPWQSYFATNQIASEDRGFDAKGDY
ncbi:MAG: DinB family protein [Oscillochloris sp.]|nr:DinB family protein [Oscillochloris sp.]